MEALGTQLAGHFHVRVWDWTLVCEDDTGNQQAPSQCRGIGDAFRSGRLGLPQILNLSCY